MNEVGGAPSIQGDPSQLVGTRQSGLRTRLSPSPDASLRAAQIRCDHPRHPKEMNLNEAPREAIRSASAHDIGTCRFATETGARYFLTKPRVAVRISGIVAAGMLAILVFNLRQLAEPTVIGSRPIVSGDVASATVLTAPVGHRCADLLVQTMVQLAVVHGVWACLEPSVQKLFTGTGDQALVGQSPYFTGDRFVGCDASMCVYAMTFEATTAGVTGLSETTMTVWLDTRGLVAHAAIPKPLP
jgi:hypothetical protein